MGQQAVVKQCHLAPGDDVEFAMRLNSNCDGLLFTVMEVTPYEWCASGFIVRIHVKDNPEKVYKSINEKGIDSSWLRKIK